MNIVSIMRETLAHFDFKEAIENSINEDDIVNFVVERLNEAIENYDLECVIQDRIASMISDYTDSIDFQEAIDLAINELLEIPF